MLGWNRFAPWFRFVAETATLGRVRANNAQKMGGHNFRFVLRNSLFLYMLRAIMRAANTRVACRFAKFNVQRAEVCK